MAPRLGSSSARLAAKLYDNAPQELRRNAKRSIKRAMKPYGTEFMGSMLIDASLELERRASIPGARRINFLDAGAGAGMAIKNAEVISPKVSAWGMAPHSPSSKEWVKKARKARPGYEPPPRKKWIRGFFETSFVPNFFHVIQVHFSIMHALNQSLALENLLNSLRNGGVLIFPRIEFMDYANIRKEVVVPEVIFKEHAKAGENRKRELEKKYPALGLKRIFAELRKQGFRVPQIQRFRDGTYRKYFYPEFLRVERTSGGKANLSRFYEHPSINRFPLTG